jgi:hypothetical protein
VRADVFRDLGCGVVTFVCDYTREPLSGSGGASCGEHGRLGRQLDEMATSWKMRVYLRKVQIEYSSRWMWCPANVFSLWRPCGYRRSCDRGCSFCPPPQCRRAEKSSSHPLHQPETGLSAEQTPPESIYASCNPFDWIGV